MASQSKQKSRSNDKRTGAVEETTLEGMHVKCVGLGVYECSSESDPTQTYHVDILCLGGLGQCDCTDFAARRRIRWREVRKPYDIFRCKHLRRVRNHVLDQILRTTMQNHNKLNRTKTYGQEER